MEWVNCDNCGETRRDDEVMGGGDNHYDLHFCSRDCGQVKYVDCAECMQYLPVADAYGGTEHDPGTFYHYDCMADALERMRERLFANYDYRRATQ